MTVQGDEAGALRALRLFPRYLRLMTRYYQFRRDGVLSELYKTPEEAFVAMIQASRDHNWKPPTYDGLYFVILSDKYDSILIRQMDAIRLWRSAIGRSPEKFTTRLNAGGIIDLYPQLRCQNGA
jgi:hypothetical protein